MQSTAAWEDCTMTVQYMGATEISTYLWERHGVDIAPATLRGYASQGKMPLPDARIGVTGGWLPQTIDAWVASRPGRGARTDLQR